MGGGRSKSSSQEIDVFQVCNCSSLLDGCLGTLYEIFSLLQ
jgi:hypothetical protein